MSRGGEGGNVGDVDRVRESREIVYVGPEGYP
jgi:hypothetical protein